MTSVQLPWLPFDTVQDRLARLSRSVTRIEPPVNANVVTDEIAFAKQINAEGRGTIVRGPVTEILRQTPLADTPEDIAAAETAATALAAQMRKPEEVSWHQEHAGRYTRKVITACGVGIPMGIGIVAGGVNEMLESALSTPFPVYMIGIGAVVLVVAAVVMALAKLTDPSVRRPAALWYRMDAEHGRQLPVEVYRDRIEFNMRSLTDQQARAIARAVALGMGQEPRWASRYTPEEHRARVRRLIPDASDDRIIAVTDALIDRVPKRPSPLPTPVPAQRTDRPRIQDPGPVDTVESLQESLDGLVREWGVYRLDIEAWYLTKPLLHVEMNKPDEVLAYEEAMAAFTDAMDALTGTSPPSELARVRGLSDTAWQAWHTANDYAEKMGLSDREAEEAAAMRRLSSLVGRLARSSRGDPEVPAMLTGIRSCLDKLDTFQITMADITTLPAIASSGVIAELEATAPAVAAADPNGDGPTMGDSAVIDAPEERPAGSSGNQRRSSTKVVP